MENTDHTFPRRDYSNMNIPHKSNGSIKVVSNPKLSSFENTLRPKAGETTPGMGVMFTKRKSSIQK